MNQPIIEGENFVGQPIKLLFSSPFVNDKNKRFKKLFLLYFSFNIHAKKKRHVYMRINKKIELRKTKYP